VEFSVNKLQTGDNDSDMRHVGDKLNRLDQGTGGRGDNDSDMRHVDDKLNRLDQGTGGRLP